MTSPKKILIVVMDGLGDRQCPELRGMTPLQYTRTPNLDWFLTHGQGGLCDPIAPGIRPGSDTAHLAILGYDAEKVYTGRGPLEAVGIGMDIRQGDVAIRCNFATVNDDLKVIDRRAERIHNPETNELVEALDGMEFDGVRCIVKEGTEHRAVLLLRGEGLSADITDSDPGSGDYLLPCEGTSPEGAFTAGIVNRFMNECYERLKNHPTNRKRIAAGLLPANMLIPRGAGMMPHIEPFEKRTGMKGACVAGVGMVRGICRICGLDVIPLPDECDGTMSSDFITKARYAVDALEDHDFVLMNCKAPDIAGHDGDAKAKSMIVRRLDEMVLYLRNSIPEDTVVVFTCDHCTPCSMTDHSGDPVPISITSPGMVWDDCTEFSETGCAKGMLGRIRGRDIIPICMDLADRTEKYGS